MSKLEELINKLCPNGVEFKKLSEVCNSLKKGTLKTSDLNANGKYPVINSGRELYGFYDEYNNKNAITLAARGEYAGYISYFENEFWAGGLCYPYSSKNEEFITNKFLYYYLKKNENKIMENLVARGSIPALNKSDLDRFLVPVPPLEVQCEIVRILDNFTLLSAELSAELSARQKQYEYYKNLLLEPKANYKNVKFMKLRDIGQVKMCKRILKSQTNSISGIPFYKIGTFGKEPDAYISEETYKEYINKYNYPKKGDILISCAGTIGRTIVYDGQPAYFQDSNIVWLEHNEKIVLNKYLMYCYSLEPWNISTGGTIARLYNDNILRAEIPLPPLEEQERIVNILDRFDKLCNDISEGLPAEIEARKKQYEYYRDKLLTFKELK